MEKLKKNSIVYKFVREPGGTIISEEIRKTLLSIKNMNMSSRSEALLMTASRAQLTKEEIIPAMEKGHCIIADRFKDSTLAYQGGGRKLDLDFLEKLNDFATYDIDPNILMLPQKPPMNDPPKTIQIGLKVLAWNFKIV